MIVCAFLFEDILLKSFNKSLFFLVPLSIFSPLQRRRRLSWRRVIHGLLGAERRLGLQIERPHAISSSSRRLGLRVSKINEPREIMAALLIFY